MHARAYGHPRLVSRCTETSDVYFKPEGELLRRSNPKVHSEILKKKSVSFPLEYIPGSENRKGWMVSNLLIYPSIHYVAVTNVAKI